MRRRRLIALAAAALPLAAVRAQTFPSKNLRLVVPFAAGGVGDLTARIVAGRLAEGLGRSVVIENRPGAGGVVAAETVARAEPDGHTLFLMSNGTAVTAGLFKSLPFDTVKDFAPVSTLGFFDIAVVAHPEAPFKSLPELLAFAKANPGKLNIGSINIGSTQHLAAELFKSSAGIDAQTVPFNGTPNLIGALRGRQVDVGVEILAPVLAQIRGGALKALAVAGEKRSPVLPEVPTAVESGVAGFVASSWNAIAAPAKTPRPVIERLQREIAAAVADAEVQKKLRELNIDPRSSTPEQATALLVNDIKRWSAVIERAGIPKQ
ncbi:MAG: tripartite tricarboxylate transporter substrate binding protein [Comamonadaceae bacterium]|jgi:tripartite-type tricarboxylate transporter receptor subunit TctC|uniref:Tripartite tricarboxylate transporter substrate binding protein n=1 Tax=Hydrogenophaga borbori TaxID=2294117 RepID=A0A372ENR5_9BURK|nr:MULTISPECIES: tripartite tricarboxylate transporter substrate binding protein [Hydrogenophaga]NCT96221.1 tripartite tricarboxylate transporter substrate binding protein [Comamonadaceae bacterium]RFP81314.1 tripartite tricarboxylate transporter substrate binding protein [Hydrogenophaga borbori]WQB85810.1 tripartite tricarboxylate transporter substrate binding protein [Hydrogenophaga sp. SNF1]